MDIQLAIIILCVLAALFFIVRRMRRAVRSGQCGCGCDGCSPKDNACSCGGQAEIKPLHAEDAAPKTKTP
ncbi:FeoB-associated Cys-rich membrane protein [Desulfovibrio legallii]|jgi:hypothetical protein|uniref:Virus attachment protein p12 family protein n=1 Tax=Desulfovibrio legallii TaxID=571438 RepID=A0A1G7NTI4_9BACT|nr:FeoB-associated Cys-rich membrane protein [Desulfovibrio legallii]SDF76540.1 Virus attachment protein p12 family protein [Desulfovibrio legallii]